VFICYDARMRTTVTLDEDVADALKRVARVRGVTFKEALNDSVRRGLAKVEHDAPYRVPSRSMGLRPGVNLDKALALAAAEEDAETIRKLELRK
jgi:hypothetical protein